MSEIIKIINERETQKKKIQRQRIKVVMQAIKRAKWFCVFKLDFLQLICEASLLFEANLDLALSVILKER